jgi:hypothetical protein
MLQVCPSGYRIESEPCSGCVGGERSLQPQNSHNGALFRMCMGGEVPAASEHSHNGALFRMCGRGEVPAAAKQSQWSPVQDVQVRRGPCGHRTVTMEPCSGCVGGERSPQPQNSNNGALFRMCRRGEVLAAAEQSQWSPVQDV